MRRWHFLMVVMAAAASLALGPAALAQTTIELPGVPDDEPSQPSEPQAEPDATQGDELQAPDEEVGAQEAQEDNPPTEGGGNAKTAQQGDRDCADFGSQEDAQDYFEEQGGPGDDPDRLDEDSDGVACESLGAPTGGVDTGGGGTAISEATSTSPLSFIAGGALFGLLLAGVAGRALRRNAAV